MQQVCLYVYTTVTTIFELTHQLRLEASRLQECISTTANWLQQRALVAVLRICNLNVLRLCLLQYQGGCRWRCGVQSARLRLMRRNAVTYFSNPNLPSRATFLPSSVAFRITWKAMSVSEHCLLHMGQLRPEQQGLQQSLLL